MKTKRVKYDAVKLAILRKKYEIDSVINQLMCEMPQFEFEKIKGLLLFRIEELKRLERQGVFTPQRPLVLTKFF